MAPAVIDDRSSRESSSKVVDALIAKGAALGILISEQVRNRIRRAITKDTPPLEILAIARKIITEAQPTFADALADALKAAWFTGGQAVLERLPAIEAGDEPPIPPPNRVMGLGEEEPIRFPIIEEAARNLATRRVMTAAEYYRANETAKQRAFTVSGVAGTDTLDKIREYLVRDIETGGTLRDFQKFMTEETALSPSRIEGLYRQQVGVSFERGQEKVVDNFLVKSLFPYVMTSVIDDSRLTELCRVISKSGIQKSNIFRTDDPVYKRFRPLRHWNCRCSSVFLTRDDAAKKGIQEAIDWAESGVEPTNPAFVDYPSVELPTGWLPSGGE